MNESDSAMRSMDRSRLQGRVSNEIESNHADRLWDVLIVGAGPAGAALAGLAAQRGLQVALIEKRSFPRHKVCGEFISAEGLATLERLGISREIERGGARPLTEGILAASPSRKVRFQLPAFPSLPAHAVGFSRAQLDDRLVAWAKQHGATLFQPAQVKRPVFLGNRVVGIEIAGHASPLRARVVVGADGRRSVLARHLLPKLGDPQRTHPRSWFGLKTHIELDGCGSGSSVELHLFRGGYVGVNAVEGARLNVCMMIRVDAMRALGPAPDTILKRLRAQHACLAATLGSGERCSKWCSVGPLAFGARRASAQGVLFVGDAAGTIDPFSGEGISNALLGAELALPVIERAVADGALSDSMARVYQERWNRAFGRVTRRVRWLGRLLEREWLAGPALWLLSGPAGRLTGPLVSTTRTAFDFESNDAG